MVERVGILIVRVAELLEAEGRIAREEAFRTAKAWAIFSGAVALVVSGLIVAAAGGCVALMQVMPPGAALALTGAFVAACGVVTGLLANR